MFFHPTGVADLWQQHVVVAAGDLNPHRSMGTQGINEETTTSHHRHMLGRHEHGG